MLVARVFRERHYREAIACWLRADIYDFEVKAQLPSRKRTIDCFCTNVHRLVRCGTWTFYHHFDTCQELFKSNTVFISKGGAWVCHATATPLVLTETGSPVGMLLPHSGSDGTKLASAQPGMLKRSGGWRSKSLRFPYQAGCLP